ncbi:MAG: helicase [Brucellaceae bacterium]|nr:helicase [Brucellaceae bacterium]
MNVQTKQTDPLVLTGRNVTAILGPTNTGKTHLAIERMVAHSSGVIGLPLRLLAREVYTRVCEKVGTGAVALITGEEKIVPPGARYSVCTVEAMPRQTDAAFAAIDEVQLAGDLERGHIFTDRLLHLRGREETLLLGAATMRPILEKMLRGITVVTRPRLSHLSWDGQRKITRLPRRSAIVAFSADEVYAIAELVKRQRGGAAIVMGALSPRTRNAQVALYQSGDVDYLVATDAIGMGLNLDVDHVAFAQDRKFDGYQFRPLTAAEIGQIAGRAGRHLRDGTFGVTGRTPVFDDALVEAVEGHQFDAVPVMQWRNARFDFSSIAALKASLETNPPVPGLTRALPATDAQALEFLARDHDVARIADNPKRVELLWEACKLPDYRRIAPAQHADIISTLYFDLVRSGHVNEDYMADQVRRADAADGDIDTLSHRIAQIRTWTYVSHRPDWLADPRYWQERTREIEDRLSDALHERLTKRFIDRRTSVLMKRLKENAMLDAEIVENGQVMVEGHHVGELEGFRFTADAGGDGSDAKAIRAAAGKALAREFETRADRFSVAPNGDLALSSDGTLRWIGAAVAALSGGEDILRPRVILLADEQLTGPARDKVQARADRFIAHHISEVVKPLTDLRDADQLIGLTRGIAFRLVENLGIVERRDIAADVKALDQEGRAALRRYGVRFGAYHIFIPALLKPAPAGLLTLLWALKHDARDDAGYGDIVASLAQGRTSVVTEAEVRGDFYRLAGFRNLGRRAVRIDILERLADLIRPAVYWKQGQEARPDGAYGGSRFHVTPAMMSILGATAEDMEEILKGLGYRHEEVAAEAFAAETARLDALYAPPKPEIEADAVAAPEAEAATEPANETAEATEASAEAGAADVEPAAAAPAEEAPVEPAPAEETPTEATADAAAPAEAVSEASEAPAPEAVEAGSEAADASPVEGEAEVQEEPKPVLVWRQGRNDRGHAPQREGRRKGGGHKRDGGKPWQKDGKGGGKPRHDAKGQPPRNNAAKPERREKAPDPNSPFAKLAALKQQLKD